MKLKLITITAILALFAAKGICLNKSDEQILLTIDKNKISKSEFLRIYNKNNSSGTLNQQEVKDYLELFVNYKLKVLEAQNQGMDTAQSFLREFNSYRDQLAKPYMRDKNVEDSLIKEAYEHIKYEVRASHLLLKLKENASPADTLVTYNKIIDIRNKIINGQASWDTMVIKHSDDSYANVSKGDLGYFTAFQMVYPFEAAAYNAKIGDITMPVRTNFGYHLLKVSDKRVARGSIKVAHIMAMFPEKAGDTEKDSTKARILRIYSKLKAGESFETLAKTYSEDKRSAVKGGELNWISVGMMIPEFEQAAFSIQNNNEFTEPIQTSFGWHIIKRLDSKPIASFEDTKEMIKTKIASDARGKMPDDVIIARSKKEFNYKLFAENLIPFYSVVDSSIYNNNWTVTKASKLNKKLFVINNKTYTQTDFANYIQADRSPKNKQNLKQIVDNLYKQFSESYLIEAFKNKLALTNTDFSNLLSEYHDGILLFNITEKLVWGKALADTVGLQKFYSQNKDKYFWNDRAEAAIYSCKELKTAETLLNVLKTSKNKLDIQAINKTVCPDTTQKCITIVEGLFEKNDNNLVDTTSWNIGLSNVIEKDQKYNIINIKSIQKPVAKTLDDAKGLYISEYQNYLEKLWIAQLRQKYKVSVNTAVMETIK